MARGVLALALAAALGPQDPGGKAPAPPAPPPAPAGPVAEVQLQPPVIDSDRGVRYQVPVGARPADQVDVKIWKYSPPGMPEGEIRILPGPPNGNLGEWRRALREQLAKDGWTVAGDEPDPDPETGRVGTTRFVNKNHPTADEQVYYWKRGKLCVLGFTCGTGPPVQAWKPVRDAVVAAFRVTFPGDSRLQAPAGATEATTDHFVIRSAIGVPLPAVSELSADCEAALAEAVALTGIPIPRAKYVVHVLADPNLLKPFAPGESPAAVYARTGPVLLAHAAPATPPAVHLADRGRAVLAQHVDAYGGGHDLPGWLVPGLGEHGRALKKTKGKVAHEAKSYAQLPAVKNLARTGKWKPLEVLLKSTAKKFGPDDPDLLPYAFAFASWLRAAPEPGPGAAFVKRYLDAYRVAGDERKARDEAFGDLSLDDAEKAFVAWAKKAYK